MGEVFRWLLINEDGSPFGTNDEAKAKEYQQYDTWLVIDTQRSVVLFEDKETHIDKLS